MPLSSLKTASKLFRKLETSNAGKSPYRVSHNVDAGSRARCAASSNPCTSSLEIVSLSGILLLDRCGSAGFSVTRVERVREGLALQRASKDVTFLSFLSPHFFNLAFHRLKEYRILYMLVMTPIVLAPLIEFLSVWNLTVGMAIGEAVLGLIILIFHQETITPGPPALQRYFGVQFDGTEQNTPRWGSINAIIAAHLQGMTNPPHSMSPRQSPPHAANDPTSPSASASTSKINPRYTKSNPVKSEPRRDEIGDGPHYLRFRCPNRYPLSTQLSHHPSLKHFHKIP